MHRAATQQAKARDAKHRYRSLAARDNSNNGDGVARKRNAAFNTDSRDDAHVGYGVESAFRIGRNMHARMMPMFDRIRKQGVTTRWIAACRDRTPYKR
jgi:hypothetical protein